MTQPDFTSPIAGRIEVRDPCPWCPDRPMVPRSLMGEHVAQMHPEVQTVEPPTDRAAEIEQLRERHAASLRRADELNNALMQEVQRYATGTEQPVLWSVYNEMHKRALNAEAEVKRLRADRAAVLDAESALIKRHCPDHGPDDQDGVWMDCHCAVADDMRKRADARRRMADETQPAEAQPESCAHCGKNILRITGTLTAWWVHAPGGHTICDPKQAASSPRATPKPAAERQDGAARDEVVHGCPPDGSGLTPCCGRTPFELPRTDRISSEAPPTCTGNGPRQDGAQPTHLGDRANAEACPACTAEAANLPYPFLCPAEPGDQARQDGAQP